MTLPHAIRRRRWALVALVAAVAIYSLVARFNVRLTYTSASLTNFEIGTQAASFEIGYNNSPWRTSSSQGWSLNFEEYSWLRGDAWRPYHRALAPLPRKSPYHYLVVPLWYAPVAAIGWVCFTHGVVRGTRRAVLNACTRCGYDLSTMPGAHADRVCPECGQRQGNSPSSRRPEPASAAMVEVKLPVRDVPAASEGGAPHSGQGAAASSPSRE